MKLQRVVRALPRRFSVAAIVLALALSASSTAHAALSFTVSNDPWPAGWRDAAIASMQSIVNLYNAYGDFGNNNIYVYYNAGIPTAQSDYQGSIGDGGTYPNQRVMQHESNHYLGSGTTNNWTNRFVNAVWTGPKAEALFAQFDGDGTVMRQSGVHFYGYGLNYDTEVVNASILPRNIAIMYAIRQDAGLGNAADPWTATSVNLTQSDEVGTSSFNWQGNWNDTYFAHPNANYTTGNFQIRTPLDTYNPGGTTPSFTFVGDSLTVNNTNGANGGLVFQGKGTTGRLTFKNLILNNGYVRHASGSGDLFQLAGKVTLTGSPIIDAAQGNISASANIGGTGSLTKAGNYALALSGANSYSGDTIINGGTLRLASLDPVASYTFDNVSGATVVNGGTGGAGMNGTLAGGATVVGGGRFGNAVSLASSASVDINNPITDLSSAGSWTVSAWLKTITPGSSILTKGDGGWSDGNTIFYLGDGAAGGSGGIPSAVRYAGGFLQGSTSATAVNNNAWHQVTYVNNGGNYSIYVDGNSQPLSAGNNKFSNMDLGGIVRLGISTNTVPADGTVNFNGLMDSVQFYNQALTTSQIATLYSGGNTFGSLPTTTNVSIAAGATLDLNGAAQQIGSLSGPAGSAVSLGNGRLIVNTTGGSIFAGTLGGTGGSLVKQGSGILTLSGANTYTGSTTIEGGTLNLVAPANGSIANSAVANYTFDNVSGASVVNGGLGGATMNGTLTGGATIVAGGHTGNAVSLAGGASVNINNPITDLGSAGNWTVSAWVKTATPGSSILTKSDGGWGTGNTVFYLGDGAAAGSGGIPSSVRYAGGFFQGSTSATPVTNNAWHQVTYVNNSGAYSLYVDGVAQPLSAGNAGFGNADIGSIVRLGATTNNIASDGTVNFNGLLDDVQFYRRALSPDQIAALYQGLNVGPLPKTTDLTIGSTGLLDLNGLSQQVASLNGVFGASISLGSGQLIVNSTTTSEYAGGITGSGGSLVKQGSGTLIITGNALHTGGTQVNGGVLRVDSSIFNGALNVNSGGTLAGHGVIYGPVTVASGGTLSPGNSPGEMVVGSLILNSGSQTQMELGGTLDGFSYDALRSLGPVTLGGALNVSLINSFLPSLGNHFELFTWTTRTGAFSSVSLPALSAGLAWNLTQLYNTGALSVVDANYLPGDINRDGSVTRADLPAMLKALTDLSAYQATNGLGGTALTNPQLMQLLDFTGDGAVTNADLQGLIDYLNSGLGTGSISTVPEPASLGLAAIAGVFAIRVRVRRRSR
jgi:fibronectin-binding autotransporter adhesin